MGGFGTAIFPGGLGALLLVSVAFTGCASSPILAPQPPQASPPVDLTAPVSYVAVPVTISTAYLAQELSRRLSDQVGEDGIFFRQHARTPIPGARITFGVNRSGPVSIHVVGRKVAYRVPLALNSAAVDWYGCTQPFGCKSTHGEFGGSGVISGETAIRVTEDWVLVSRTRFRFSWLETPWVHLRTTVDHGRTPLHPLVDLLVRAKIRRLLATYAKRIDSTLESFDLRRYLEPAWRRIHSPQRFASDLPIWLSVDGVGAGVGPLQGDNDNVLLTPMVAARLRAHVGKQPAGSDAAPPLPRNSGLPGRDHSEIQLPIVIEYAYLNTLLKERVMGRTFEFKNGAKVAIKDVELFATGNRVVARVEFDADKIPSRLIPSASGTVYFSGRPAYDKATRQLTVQDFDFDVQTQEYLHKAAAWLLQETFVQRVRQKLVFDVSKKVDPILAKFEESFSTYALAKGITLTTRIQEITMEGDPVVSAESVTIVAIGRGSTWIHVDAAPRIESLQAVERAMPESSRTVDREDDESDDPLPDDLEASTP
jgi:Domain of unknown function (DUF4403)